MAINKASLIVVGGNQLLDATTVASVLCALPLKKGKTTPLVNLFNRSIFAKLCFINRTTPKPKVY